MEAIVLAGGFGTRLRSICSDRPKPMAPVAGRPFLERLMDYWITQNVTHFILSVGYLHHVITSHFGSSYKNIPITYSIEERPLGTGGGLLHALDSLRNPASPFLVLNGDTFFEVSLNKLLRFHKAKKSQCTLSLYPRQDNPRYDSLQLSPSGRIQCFIKDPTQTPHLINGGCYLFKKEHLEHFTNAKENISLEKEILPFMIDQKECFGLQLNRLFIDIGLPEDLAKSQTLLEEICQ